MWVGGWGNTSSVIVGERSNTMLVIEFGLEDAQVRVEGGMEARIRVA